MIDWFIEWCILHNFVYRIIFFLSYSGDRTFSFTKKISREIWSRMIYSDLQYLLSNSEKGRPGCLGDMETLSSLLFSVARVWDVSETDPVLSSSYSLLSSLLLDRIGQHRSAISLLKKVWKYLLWHLFQNFPQLFLSFL